MDRIRIQPPGTACGDLTPFLPPQALEIHVQLICGRLAAELNMLLDGYPEMHGMDASEIYSHIGMLPRVLREDVRFAAGGIVSHEYFFRYLSQSGGQNIPDSRSAAALRRSFGSSDSFFYIFREEAQRMKYGGFLWLCLEQHARHRFLRLIPARGYELPLPLTPVFALDLWEHAYISTYGSDRRAYADAFLRFPPSPADGEKHPRRYAGRCRMY